MIDTDLVFKAMGDPTRLQILRMLAENGEMCVCKITEQLDLSQPSISHHLSALRNAGLVTVNRKGQWSHYSLRAETISDVMAFVVDIMEKVQKTKARESSKQEECCPAGKGERS